jgi:peptide subunit release factor 1 (eRF1)
MAFKLNKTEIKQHQDLSAALRAAFDEITAATIAFNEAIGNARDFASRVAGEREENIGNKSEAWQEGDRGQAAQAWVESWAECDLGEMDEPDESIVEAFEQLEQGAES